MEEGVREVLFREAPVAPHLFCTLEENTEFPQVRAGWAAWALAFWQTTTRELWVGALLLLLNILYYLRKRWHAQARIQKEREEEELERERELREPPLLQLLPPGSRAGKNQSLAWVRLTMKVDQEGDMAHDFLGPF
eukprot:gb/GEZN01016768.1/.p1 GENE.gb/GEZN01016768.1/~~gb/GEZN01016768.1/.p1  ORF type:complete len:136 (+),score=21.00 gb/GEZN01016768.1/:211-618(+)